MERPFKGSLSFYTKINHVYESHSWLYITLSKHVRKTPWVMDIMGMGGIHSYSLLDHDSRKSTFEHC